MQKITTFFMFGGKAEEAMNFYTSRLEKSKIQSITHYDPNEVETGAEGTSIHATFKPCGQEFMYNRNVSTGTFSDDSNTFTGNWERSGDGVSWLP
jgi:predicted 3-demethylubiquinone-9 3-methyltransferase (glyoxalase superfamily)